MGVATTTQPAAAWFHWTQLIMGVTTLDGGDNDDATTTASGSWDNVVEHCVKPVVMYYIPFLLACYGASTLLLRYTFGYEGLKLQKLAGSLSMYPAFLGLIYWSHATMLEPQFWSHHHHHHTHHARLLQSSLSCDRFANLYVAANIVQAIGQLQTEKPPLLYQLMAHHVLSIACYVAGFYFDRFRWWTAFAGSCEITNLFLVPVFMCKEFFPSWKTEWWYLWNSRLLWFLFITHRLVLFPAWLGLWFWDRYQQVTVVADEATAPMISIHWFEGIVYPVTIAGLFVLSIIWFRTISRGLQKQTVAYLDAQRNKKQA